MLIGELIPYLVKYLKGNPDAPEHGEFAHLLIDEYQDLNKAEQTALAYLGANAQVCIVGDDDQSIYSFKHAHPDGIRTWKDENPGCNDLAMTECHRCPTGVVSLANDLIDNNTNREPRALEAVAAKGGGEVSIVQLTNLDEEATWVANKVAEIIKETGVHPSEIIVLTQRSSSARRIVEAMRGKETPVKSYYDESQLDSSESRRRFALLKLFLDNEDRVALRYLVGCATGDFRAKAYARLRAHCELSGESPWHALSKALKNELKIQYTQALVDQFAVIKGELDAIEAIGDDLKAFIETLFPASVAELADLRALALDQVEGCDDVGSLYRGMLREINQPDIPPEVDAVRVMSLHKSKGLSSPYVFIAGCVQGMLPQLADSSTPKALADAQLEESRRLFYVGITRVKADPDKGRPGNLYLTYARFMPTSEAYASNILFSSKVGGLAKLLPSQFIEELGPTAPVPEAF
jgi:superfamily I DNA/RNA helicase